MYPTPVQRVPALVFVLALAFDAICLIDLARGEEARYGLPIGWLILIGVLTPFGDIAYLTVGKIR